jgi:hypothetical protein
VYQERGVYSGSDRPKGGETRGGWTEKDGRGGDGLEVSTEGRGAPYCPSASLSLSFSLSLSLPPPPLSPLNACLRPASRTHKKQKRDGGVDSLDFPFFL